jgi:hypothetical protein
VPITWAIAPATAASISVTDKSYSRLVCFMLTAP